MASPKMFAEVTIAGSYKNLSKSTRGASKELKGFEKTAKKISGAIKGAFAGIAVAGLNVVADAIIDMSKAAADDAKSMALLNKQMANTWKATDKTKTEMNDYIDSVSNMSGILDDDLRPAFSKIVRVTKGPTTAMKAFNRVMDISAGTGKDVNTVASAYSKYLAGNKTSLQKLIPGLKEAGNASKFLDEQFKGMAETSGANDPFAQINAVMENFKEKIGTAFLPAVQGLADWLKGDEAQAKMDEFAKSVEKAVTWFSSKDGQKGMEAFKENALKIGDAIIFLTDNLDKLKPLFDFMEWSVNNAPNLLNILKFFGVGADDTAANTKATIPTTDRSESRRQIPTAPGKTGTTSTGQVVNITVNAPSVAAHDVVKSLQAAARSKGISMRSLLA
jgi:hypothetical protein